METLLEVTHTDEAPIVIATDASYEPTTRAGGGGWIALDFVTGAKSYGYMAMDGGNHEQETARRILKRFVDEHPHRRIIILIDSLKAMHGMPTARAYAKVEYRWVKGHNGHPLNEAADVLAKAGRTCFEKDAFLARGEAEKVAQIALNLHWDDSVLPSHAYSKEFELLMSSGNGPKF